MRANQLANLLDQCSICRLPQQIIDGIFNNDQLKEMIESALAAQPIQYYTIITFDREYTAIDSETDSGENF